MLTSNRFFRCISTYWDINLHSKCLPAHCDAGCANFMQTLIFAFGCGSWPFRWMNRYPVGFWAGPTRFLLVFHAISTQILKCCLCAIFRVYYLSLPFSIFFPAVIWSRLIQCRLPVLCRLHLLHLKRVLFHSVFSRGGWDAKKLSEAHFPHLALFLCVSVDRSCLSRGNLVLRSQLRAD